MTTSVADKTPIPAKAWRRHKDPPGLWFAVAIGSVSLHLLVFWWMRSSHAFGLWFPQPSQSEVPVELIEIAPESESTNKIAASQPQNSGATPTAETVPPKTNSDRLQPENDTNAAQLETPEASPTPTPTPSTEPTPTPETTPTPTPTPTVPVGALPWNRREEIELGKGTPLPSDVPPVTPEQIQKSSAVEENIPGDRNQESSPTPTQATADTPTQESSPTPTQATADTPTQESSPTPTQATADTPTQESSPTPTGGGAIATFAPLAENEARQLVNDLPEVLSTYQGSTTKTLDSSYLPGDSALQPAKLLASLVIDQNGTFQQAKVLEIAPASLQAEKSFYEQIISELFRNENFSPGHNRDGTKPDLSNLFVRITIEPTNQ